MREIYQRHPAVVEILKIYKEITVEKIKILVTGALGVIGSNLYLALKQKGHEVWGLDIIPSNDENIYECSVASFMELKKIFEKHQFDYVYHLAASFGRKRGEDRYENLWNSNAVGTKNIIRLQEQYKFKLIFASSSEIYGDYKGVMHENIPFMYPIQQQNDYACSKWVNEMQIRNSMTAFKTESVIIRFFNLYGKEPFSEYRSVICKFIYKALFNYPYTVFLNYFRTSCYIDDAVNTLCNIINNFHSGEIYNIGGTERHDIKTISKMILEYLKKDDSLVQYEEFDLLTTKDKNVDCSKAKHHLNHNPKITLAEGIPLTIEWMKKLYNK